MSALALADVADLRRALPAHIIDKIRDGVPGHVLATQRADQAIFTALRATASSAIQRGWDYTEWAALVTERSSHLGTQVIRQSNGRERSQRAVEKKLRDAWAGAEKFVATAPPAFTAADVPAEIAAVRAWLSDADTELTDGQRAVLNALCDIGTKFNTTRPAAPRRMIHDLSGLNEKAARVAVAQLVAGALLVLASRGRASENAALRKAALYHLPSTEARSGWDADAAAWRSAGAREPLYRYRETRSVGPNAQVYGPQARTGLGPKKKRGNEGKKTGPKATPAAANATTSEPIGRPARGGLRVIDGGGK